MEIPSYLAFGEDGRRITLKRVRRKKIWREVAIRRVDRSWTTFIDRRVSGRRHRGDKYRVRKVHFTGKGVLEEFKNLRPPE